jgi:hypothetical protein
MSNSGQTSEVTPQILLRAYSIGMFPMAEGADDPTLFWVDPDLRGIFVRGSGPQTISGTAYSGTFGAKQADAVGPHTHGFDDFYKSSSLTKTNDNDRTDAQTIRMINVSIVETDASEPNTTNSQSPAGTTETRPANIALLYCIKI